MPQEEARWEEGELKKTQTRNVFIEVQMLDVLFTGEPSVFKANIQMHGWVPDLAVDWLKC